MTRLSLLGRVVAAWLLAALLLPAAGRAEEQPAILKAYGLDWIERVTDEAWPQPKAERPVICLLDTGVDVTPDTPADDPNGPIVARLALDGGTGTSQGTGYPYDHGTQMASIIAAPRNGWGTVGVFPQGRIVSIRVTDGTETFITPGAVRKAVRICTQWGVDHVARIAAIAVPESNYEQRPADVPLWASGQELAELADAVVVAALGNDADSSAVAPTAVPGIVSIAAGDEAGVPCSFVSGQDQSAALRGPGCASNGSWPQGSSAATAAVAALVGALVSHSPARTAATVRADLRANAVSLGAGASLRAAGLAEGFPVIPPSIAAPSGVTVVPDQTETQAPPAVVRLWRPRVSMRWSNGTLSVSRRDRHGRGRVAARCEQPGASTPLTLQAIRPVRVVRFALGKRPRRCEVWIESTQSGLWRSLAVRSRVS